MAYDIVQEELPKLIDQLKVVAVDIKNLEQEIEKVKAPWTPGRTPEMN
jgi:hypothetical protein